MRFTISMHEIEPKALYVCVYFSLCLHCFPSSACRLNVAFVVVAAAVVVVVAAAAVIAAAVVAAVVVAAVVAAAAIVKALVYAGSPLFLLNVSSLSCRARSGGHSPQEDTKWYKKESPTNQSRPLPCVTKLGVTHQELSNRLFYRTWPVLYFVAIPRVVILLGA